MTEEERQIALDQACELVIKSLHRDGLEPEEVVEVSARLLVGLISDPPNRGKAVEIMHSVDDAVQSGLMHKIEQKTK